MTIERLLADSAETERLGAALSRCAPRSARSALVVFLHGELGTGKTTLARGLLHQLGVTGHVRSPSYTLVETYEAGGLRILHLDLYRLEGARDLAVLGLRDELDPATLLLIEWPERAAPSLPPPDLRITLSMSGDGRLARLKGETAAGSGWLEALGAELAIAEMKGV